MSSFTKRKRSFTGSYLTLSWAISIRILNLLPRYSIFSKINIRSSILQMTHPINSKSLSKNFTSKTLNCSLSKEAGNFSRLKAWILSQQLAIMLEVQEVINSWTFLHLNSSLATKDIQLWVHRIWILLDLLGLRPRSTTRDKGRCSPKSNNRQA